MNDQAVRCRLCQSHDLNDAGVCPHCDRICHTVNCTACTTRIAKRDDQ